MTTANKLTLLRVFMIPLMVIVLYLEPLKVQTEFLNMTWSTIIFSVLFVLASLTDFLDGYIARKYNQITTFGKFLDPIADKVLVFTALLHLMMVMPNRVPLWTVMIILVREFMVTGVRLLAVEKGTVIAASKWGKYKTASTMVAIIILLFNDFGLTSLNANLVWIGNIVYYIAVFFTIYSGWDYLYKNRQVILESV
ncbi:CDP-diacylglycerol--glycerol-3-phosphate 3-phosphatidyltransferase [Acholeplasma hippikon]|uniref:CDP-diacylglycerol--glycerol-3-phosphate 3-phosphatidyltransferase n=1 Tax=Acholeplasma hippikon TaxID=264636 RepID=A0A449BJH9_9MOLU|nr:CDP-diacylglycerol--glycerol-3-phosphate 3-phosphatidyltransferase [Acholeplasma hippikon]VEU82580.1 CDP-diacylglycerol--glycerol-3-phosphate 3-phosphatidyltransferase [Acholeplasma hippikon]